jgi:uncharacterized protein YbjT (DUF2867 family)
MTDTILVTGATGNVGSLLVDLLQARDVHLRTLPRQPRPMDRATLATVTDGVDAVFLACGNVPEQVDFECALIDQAAQAGVRRIVKLSARGADPAATPAYWRWHAQIEQYLRASGVPAVVLQPSFLMSNLFAATEHVREQGMLFAPAADARISMIHPGDVAAGAAVALTTDGHDGATYVLTGPEAITYTQVAADLSTALGRPVGYAGIPPEVARMGLLAAGLPEFVVDQLLEVFAALRGGAQADTTDAVQRLTGWPPQSFATWAATYGDAFRGADSAALAG